MSQLPILTPRVFVFYAAPPIIWGAAILLAGSDAGSADESRGWLSGLLAWIGLDQALSAQTVQVLNVTLRKTGHVLSYALLAFLLGRFNRQLRPGLDSVAVGVAWVVAVVWAGVDEFHQSFYASRGSSAGDVMIDAAGAALGLFLYRTWLRRQHLKTSSPSQ